MNKVLIDFYGGMHGHFLECILNGLDSPTPDLINRSPFRTSDKGTSRNRMYREWSLRFCAEHFFHVERLKKHQSTIDNAEQCISIKLAADRKDLMLYLRLMFGRSLPPDMPQPGPFSEMHIDFYHKMSSTFMLPLRNYVSTRFGEPADHMQDIEIHVLRATLMYLMSADSQLSTILETKIPFYPNKTQHVFMFSWFYDHEKFIQEIKNLAGKFSIDIGTREHRVRELHQEFLSLNEFANDTSYQRCQLVLDNLDSCDPMPDLDVLEQAWVLSRLELRYNKKISYTNNEFFKTPRELNQYITLL